MFFNSYQLPPSETALELFFFANFCKTLHWIILKVLKNVKLFDFLFLKSLILGMEWASLVAQMVKNLPAI